MIVSVPHRRALRHPATDKPGTRPIGPWWWRTETNTVLPRVVWMCCPRGHVASLGDHQVAADGTVTPSVVCPQEGCDWHVTALLSEWGT